MKIPAFLSSEYPDSAPDKARFHVIPVPMERTVSYGAGACNGPAAILHASQQLEAWDGTSSPCALGVHTQAPIDCSGTAEETLDRIKTACQSALDAGAIPVVLGGEHTVSYGPVAALASKDTDFGVIHFDAHCDLRSSYEDDKWSHACVLRRIVEDFGVPLVQFATRDYCREEADFRAQTPSITAYDAADLARNGIPASPLPEGFPKRVYVTFDVDGFDSSLMPATGTPSPGGLMWHEAMTILERCIAGRTVIGLDVVELAPIEGLHHADFTAAKLVHALMGMAQRSWE